MTTRPNLTGRTAGAVARDTARDTARDAVRTTAPGTRPADTVTTEELAMHLIHEELARSHQAERQREAERLRRAYSLLAARRWQRRAESAGRRARLAAEIASH